MKNVVVVWVVAVLFASVTGFSLQIGIEGSIGYQVSTAPELNTLVNEANSYIDLLNTSLPSDITGTYSHFNQFTGAWCPGGDIDIWVTPWLGLGVAFEHLSSNVSSSSSFSILEPGVGTISLNLVGKIGLSANLMGPSAMFRVGFGPFSANTKLLIAYCRSDFSATATASDVSLQGTNINFPGDLQMDAVFSLHASSWGYEASEELGYDVGPVSTGLKIGYRSVPVVLSAELNGVTQKRLDIGGWFIALTIGTVL